ncbi:MAG: GTPase Era [Alphaproteobacteria bacterium MarineAlpha9_Bin6]|nr:MAG: GTPase Era [Alphaproteobacteria bacterium MarineAlpha9_Bin6]
MVLGNSRCMFVALLGAPNVGKSTLLNRVVGAKISIVTPKVQTTRTRIVGIAMRGKVQIIFLDTPGIFKPRQRLQRAMVEAAWSSARQADSIVLLIDANAGLTEDSCRLITKLKDQNRPTIVALNKIDLIKPPRLLKLTSSLNTEGFFTDTFMISALTGDGVEDLVAKLAESAPTGPWLYPKDQLSDVPLRMLAAEITREKLFLQLQNELPYSTAIETEEWNERKDGGVRIDQTIYVQRNSQKMIVVGKNGTRIKSIGSVARCELEKLLERRVHLFLHVKVRRDWSERPDHYRTIGLNFNA